MIAFVALVGFPIGAKDIEGLGSRQLSLRKSRNRLSRLVADAISGGVSILVPPGFRESHASSTILIRRSNLGG